MNQIKQLLTLGDFHELATFLLTGKEQMQQPPELHYKLLEHYQSPERSVAIVCPVGFAKSTTLKNFDVYELLNKSRFVLYVSSSFSKVVAQMTSVAKLLKNQNLQAIYNYKVVSQNQTEIVININGQNRCIAGVSANADILGINFESHRPDLITIDDIEEQEQARNVQRTAQLLDWIESSLISRLPSLVEGKVRLIGTNLSQISIINQLITGKIQGWKVYKYTCYNPDTNQSWWESKHPTEALQLASIANPSVFARNYLNDPVDYSEGLIKHDDLRFYEILPKLESVYIHVDTTHTGKTTSDFFACGAIGEGANKNLYLADFVLDKMNVEKQARTVIVFYLKIVSTGSKVAKLTYDEKANQGFGYWIKKLAKEEYGISLPIEELKYSSDKVSHFTPHVPHFKANRVYFPTNHPMLKTALDQILPFPQKGVNDDAVDMLSGCLDNFHIQDSVADIWEKYLNDNLN